LAQSVLPRDRHAKEERIDKHTYFAFPILGIGRKRAKNGQSCSVLEIHLSYISLSVRADPKHAREAIGVYNSYFFVYLKGSRDDSFQSFSCDTRKAGNVALRRRRPCGVAAIVRILAVVDKQGDFV
jgi:hypothetical protein